MTDYGAAADDLWNTPATMEKAPAKSSGSSSSGGSKSSGSSGGGGGSRSYSSGGGGGGGGSSYTRLDAKAILVAGMQGILGRAPTKKEIDKYLASLTAAAPGSADATAQFTTDWLDKNLHKGVGTQQVAQNYMSVFENALKAPGGV